MGTTDYKNFQREDEISHRITILRQIRKTNDIISGFNETPTLIDPYTNKTNYVVQAQAGKTIALSVLVLLANVRPILPPEYFKRLYEDNKYKQAFQTPYQFLSEDPIIQFDGIVKILAFYTQLLDAIYSLPDFSDVLYMNSKKLKRKEQGIDEDTEENLFEM